MPFRFENVFVSFINIPRQPIFQLLGAIFKQTRFVYYRGRKKTYMRMYQGKPVLPSGSVHYVLPHFTDNSASHCADTKITCIYDYGVRIKPDGLGALEHLFRFSFISVSDGCFKSNFPQWTYWHSQPQILKPYYYYLAEVTQQRSRLALSSSFNTN